MSKLILLYLIFVFGMMFTLIPNTGVYGDFFLFAPMKLSLEAHIYFICERLSMIILSYIIAKEATEYTEALSIFFWLLVADLIDYCLTYSSVWFNIGDIPVSMNVVKCVVFGVVILNEIWKRFFK